MSGINLLVLGSFLGGVSVSAEVSGIGATGGTNSVSVNITSGPNWDIENLYYNPPTDKRYWVSTTSSHWTAQLGQELTNNITGINDNDQRGIFLGGTYSDPRVFITGATGDKVYSYRRSSLWSVAGDPTGSYDVQTFSLTGQTTAPIGLFFSTDGTVMFVGDQTNKRILQYDLSTAWDITSATYSKALSVSSEIVTLGGFCFNELGSLIVVIDIFDDEIHRYENVDYWDLGNTSYANDSYDLTTYETSPYGVGISEDGLHLWVVGLSSDKISHFELGTGNTLSTASLADQLTLNQIDPYGLWVDPYGRYFAYIRDSYTQRQYVYAMGSFDVSGVASDPGGIFVSADGYKLYITDTGGDTLEQYSMSGAFDLNSISYVRSQSISSSGTTPYGLFFKSDGTKLFFVEDSGNTVDSYELSTAWDISSITNNATYGISAKVGTPRGITFSSDGTKMFVCGAGSLSGGYGVAAYSLSTAWDITSASFTADLNTSNTTDYDVSPTDVRFSSDGKTLYVCGLGLQPSSQNNVVVQFTLDTAYDLTSVSDYKKNGMGDLATEIDGIAWQADGSGLWMLGGTNIYKFTIAS